MHLIEPVRSCIDDIIHTTGSGMKSMVLDDFTTGVISSGYSRSEMLLREVYLFERIDTIFETSERLNHMKCIVILRPTKENVELLTHELNRPHYRTYHLYFTCRVGSTLIRKLSEADETEVVRCIKELPLDYHPVTPFLFTLKVENRTFNLDTNSWLPDGLKRTSDGLVSALIALQINPVIRYQTQSGLCRILAEKVSNMMKNESTGNKTWQKVAPLDNNNLLVFIDRRNDLITPIVNKWTYYAMIHEQFNITNNRINLVDVPNRQVKDPTEMLISIENDQFFDENYHQSYGELGVTLKNSIENLKSQTKSKHSVETMEDMKRFIDEYPETRRYASNLHNHVFLVSELTRIVTEHNLITLSECEQELACSPTSSSELIKKLKQLVSSSMIRPLDAVRLVSLFTVCKSSKSGLNDLIKVLKSRCDISERDVKFISQLREFTLSKPQNPLDETVQQVTRMIVQGVKGVENILTQYRPNLAKTIDDLRKGYRLKETDYAFSGERPKTVRDEPPKRLILFLVGGVTYDEALLADQMNRSTDTQVIVGGTSIHNFRSFKDEVTQAILRKDSGK